MRPKFSQTLRSITMAFEVEFRQNITDGFFLFGIIFQPLLIAFMALWMLKDTAPDFAIFVVVGSSMTGLWTTLLFDGGNSITRERWTGTLEPLVAAPTSLRTIVFGKVLASISQSLLSMVSCYLLISFILGYPLQVEKPGLFFMSLLFTVFAFVCFGLILSTLFILIPDFQRLQNTLEFPIYILCGFLFPVALLPGWSTPFSYILSPYWAARALHGASSGSLSDSQIYLSLGILILFCLTYIYLSRGLFNIVLKKAREDATLDTTG